MDNCHIWFITEVWIWGNWFPKYKCGNGGDQTLEVLNKCIQKEAEDWYFTSDIKYVKYLIWLKIRDHWVLRQDVVYCHYIFKVEHKRGVFEDETMQSAKWNSSNSLLSSTPWLVTNTV